MVFPEPCADRSRVEEPVLHQDRRSRLLSPSALANADAPASSELLSLLTSHSLLSGADIALPPLRS
eukprot:2224498-Rhodomonas_salina.1